MSGVRSTIRRALGISPAPQAPTRQPFFGTKRTLLQVFGLGIRHRMAMQEAAQVSRRKGLSAKSPFARAKGTIQGKLRRGRATGPGSRGYEDSIIRATIEGRWDEAHWMACDHMRQLNTKMQSRVHARVLDAYHAEAT